MVEVCVVTSLNTPINTFRNAASYSPGLEFSEERIAPPSEMLVVFHQTIRNHMPLDRTIRIYVFHIAIK
jgi:hypothetical protein